MKTNLFSSILLVATFFVAQNIFAYDIAIRSKCHIEERGEHGLKRIIVDEIPYGVNKALMITKAMSRFLLLQLMAIE